MVERRRVFNTVVESYERYRPGYPTEVMDRVTALTGLGPDTRVLEVGPGTGQATRQLAERGADVLCVEMGDRLADCLRGQFEQESRVRVENALFEEWSPPAERFDVLFAAQSFHHLDRDVRLTKSAGLLSPGGSLALVWNMPQRAEAPVDDEVALVYQAHAPHIRPSWRADSKAFETEVADSGLFQAPDVYRHHWERTYSADDYVGLLGTHSDHLMLPEAERDSLLSAVGAVVERNGGSITVPWETYLYHAKVIDQ